MGGHEGPPYPPTLGRALGEPGALLDGALPNARKGPRGTRGAPRWRAPQRSEGPSGNPGRSSMARSPTLGRALGEPGALLDGALPNARKGPRGTRGAPRWRAPQRSEGP